MGGNREHYSPSPLHRRDSESTDSNRNEPTDLLYENTARQLNQLINDYGSYLVSEMRNYDDIRDDNWLVKQTDWIMSHKDSPLKRFIQTPIDPVDPETSRQLMEEKDFLFVSRGLLFVNLDEEPEEQKESQSLFGLRAEFIAILKDEEIVKEIATERTRRIRQNLIFILDLKDDLYRARQNMGHDTIQACLQKIEEHAQKQEYHLDSKWKWFLDGVYFIFFPLRGLYALGKAIVNRATYGAWDYHFFYHSKNREFDDKAIEIIHKEQQGYDDMSPALDKRMKS